MISLKILPQLIVTVFKENLNLYPLYFTVVLYMHLKQYLFQSKLQRTGLESFSVQFITKLNVSCYVVL